MEFLALCYHYVRDEKAKKAFPRILGHSEGEFRNQLESILSHYTPLSLEEVRDFYYTGHVPEKILNSKKRGLLVCFDDGLSEHYKAALILNEYGIKGAFFIPSCILENEPANPQIIHYMLAASGIKGFLVAYRSAIEKYSLSLTQYDIPYERGSDDPWRKIAELKETFKYKLDYETGRKILMFIFETFQKRNPDAMKVIHLTTEQIKEMALMGHSIGAHTHTHLSVATSKLTSEYIEREITMPRIKLEQTTGVPVFAFSYPFGRKKDCLTTQELISKTRDYKLALTIERGFNTKDTSPFELKRYSEGISHVDLEELVAVAKDYRPISG